MNLLVAGSRSIREFNLAPYIPADTELIISGGAAGIDSIAEKFADDRRLSKLILRPQYHKYGRAAPIRRNKIMVEQADQALIIWDGVSKGTRTTIRYAEKLRKRVTVVVVGSPDRCETQS